METGDPPPGLVPGRNPDPGDRPGLHAGNALATGPGDGAGGEQGQVVSPAPAKTIEGQKPVDPDPMPDIILRNPADWQRVNNGMQAVMHGARGTARKAALGAQYRIAGKSGTAQVVAIKQGEKYDRSKVQERHRDHALFVVSRQPRTRRSSCR